MKLLLKKACHHLKIFKNDGGRMVWGQAQGLEGAGRGISIGNLSHRCVFTPDNVGSGDTVWDSLE